MIRGLSVWTARVVVLAMGFGLVVAAPAGAATEKRYKDELFEVKVKRDITYGLEDREAVDEAAVQVPGTEDRRRPGLGVVGGAGLEQQLS